jgi:hypothetical protein
MSRVIVKYRITPKRLWSTDPSATQTVAGLEGESYLDCLAERAPGLPQLIVGPGGQIPQTYTFARRDFTAILFGIRRVLSRVETYRNGGQQSGAFANNADLPILPQSTICEAGQPVNIESSTQRGRVRYADDAGFSFELPDEWRRLPNYTNLNFECKGSHIQVKADPIAPKFIARQSRIEFLAEPGSKVVDEILGEESNSVMLLNSVTGDGAISAVRSNTHYFVEFTHGSSEHVRRGVQMLIKTFRYPL